MSLTWLKEKETKRAEQEKEYKDKLENIPEVKPEVKPEKIEDSEIEKLVKSNKRLQEIIEESNKRQEDILKALQELKKSDKEVHEKIEKTPIEKIIEEREKHE
jgi:hypothetical protein